ncbi:hypothetical protein TNCV_329621 [Trichonephila clavipes]|nr:hypothetical protein TNCV_329621 [Trichonephila clavipes]
MFLERVDHIHKEADSQLCGRKRYTSDVTENIWAPKLDFTKGRYFTGVKLWALWNPRSPRGADGGYIEVKVGITFQDGDRFNSCQVIYSQFGLPLFPIFISEFCLAMKRTSG